MKRKTVWIVCRGIETKNKTPFLNQNNPTITQAYPIRDLTDGTMSR
jgi:hypothetical protein